MSINLETIDPFRNLYKKDNIYLTFSGKPDKGFKKVSSRKVVSFFENYIKKILFLIKIVKKLRDLLNQLRLLKTSKQIKSVKLSSISFQDLKIYFPANPFTLPNTCMKSLEKVLKIF